MRFKKGDVVTLIKAPNWCIIDGENHGGRLPRNMAVYGEPYTLQAYRQRNGEWYIILEELYACETWYPERSFEKLISVEAFHEAMAELSIMMP